MAASELKGDIFYAEQLRNMFLKITSPAVIANGFQTSTQRQHAVKSYRPVRPKCVYMLPSSAP